MSQLEFLIKIGNEIGAECKEKAPKEPLTDEDKKALIAYLDQIAAEADYLRHTLNTPNPITVGEVRANATINSWEAAQVKFWKHLTAVENRAYAPWYEWMNQNAKRK